MHVHHKQEINQMSVSHFALFLSFHTSISCLFCNGANIVLKTTCFLQIFPKTLEVFLMECNKFVSVLLNLPYETNNLPRDIHKLQDCKIWVKLVRRKSSAYNSKNI